MGRGLVGVVLVLGAASAVGTGLRVESVRGGAVRAAAERGASTVVEVVVKSEGRVTGKGVVVVEGRAVWAGVGGGVRVRTPVVVLARQGKWREAESGQRIRTRGRLAVPERGELLGAVVLARGDPEVVQEAGSAQRAATQVRDALREAVRGLEPGARGVVPAMVLGDTAGIDAELKEEFVRAGLVHCLVVSGANFSILVVVVLWTGRRAGLGNRAGAVLAGGVVLGFVLVVGMEPSVLRATVMGLIGLAAVCTGRERQGVPALAAAVIVLVLADPGLARSYGFALSVTATSGLLLLAPRWRDRLAGAGLSRRLAEATAVPLAAQAAVGPILVLLAGTVSLVAVPANVLAAPAIAVATVCGFLTAAVAPFFPDLATLTVRPAGWAAGWVITVARAFAAVPHGTIPWHQGLLGALLLTALTAALAVAVRNRSFRRLTAAALAGLALAAVTFRFTAPSWPPRDWRLVACDVGQGDALVLHAAPGQAVVVDAGPDPVLVDRCLSRLSVRAVPLLFITHPHADHLAGLPGITRNRTLSTLVHTPLTPADPQLRALHAAGLRPAARFPAPEAVRRSGKGRVRVTGAAAGERLRAGEVEIEVLAPRSGREVLEGAGGTEVNNVSLVLVARWDGLTVLLGGDLEEEGQRALRGLVPQVDVLKVPHHGSARQEPAFLTEGRPRAALISVGRDNDYGHPSERLLGMLRGIRVYRTDRHGDIAVTAPSGGLEIVTRS
ncbi:ComEC/Rec2 family competence protein [Actinocorallia populi]|uniref:ComEC/Rec2 family competence protein n=1 Tax=Actinocorallia populi TaxID=2079200 RepID=UPI0013009AB9|nr:ComEC/Rec2 family competence protein [Actinocorallia populi]